MGRTVYIHLCDAVVGNVDETTYINNISTACILPSLYIGSPLRVQEYIQNAMTFVRAYSRPDLFITYTCHPNWDEIKILLYIFIKLLYMSIISLHVCVYTKIQIVDELDYISLCVR